MENDNNGESTLGLIATVTGLIIFVVSIFAIFYSFIARRARRKITMAVAWLVVFCLSVNALMMLYDRVLDPLKDGMFRWPDKPDIMLRLGIAYVLLYFFALWESRYRPELDLEDD